MTVVYHRPPRTTITTSIPAAPANGDLASSHHQRHVRTTSQGFAIDLIPELVRTGRAWGSGAQSPRSRRAVGSLTTGVPESPGKKSGRRCRIGAEAFVAGVSGRPRGGAPRRREPRS